VLLRNVRPFGGPARDLLVGDGRIVEVGEGLPAPEGVAVLDGHGHLALPGLVDAHAHLDKTLWGLPWRPHSAGGGGLAALIENEHRGRSELARSGVTVAERAGNLLGAYAAAGTAHLRSHVDVDTAAGLDSLHGVMEARAAFADRVSVELVAFPQSGLLVRPGTLQLLEEAVLSGAELVGGLDPAGFDHRPVEHLDAVFGIADRHGCGLDIHLHDGGELGAFELDLIIERTRALGLAGKVTVGHAFALAEVPEPRLGRPGRGPGHGRCLADHGRPRQPPPTPPGPPPHGRGRGRPGLRRHPRPVVPLGRRRRPRPSRPARLAIRRPPRRGPVCRPRGRHLRRRRRPRPPHLWSRPRLPRRPHPAPSRDSRRGGGRPPTQVSGPQRRTGRHLTARGSSLMYHASAHSRPP
jgi:hypothetical protein